MRNLCLLAIITSKSSRPLMLCATKLQFSGKPSNENDHYFSLFQKTVMCNFRFRSAIIEWMDVITGRKYARNERKEMERSRAYDATVKPKTTQTVRQCCVIFFILATFRSIKGSSSVDISKRQIRTPID